MKRNIEGEIEFLSAELANVEDILNTLSPNDFVGRMSFEGRKQRIEAELKELLDTPTND